MSTLMYEEDLLDDEVVDEDPLTPFLDDGTIVEVLGELKSGKEGTVYCCRPHPTLGVDLVAAKVFRGREERTFRNQAGYREGRPILNQRDARAYKKKTAWGRRVETGTWLRHEYEILDLLFGAGGSVPRPLASTSNVILMEFIGDEESAAPKLQETELQELEAIELFEKVIENIELFLSRNWIHADLSAYNILYWHGEISIIDFPQAVDARTNRNASMLLTRDIENVCRYFRKQGVESDPEAISRRLWRRYVRAEL
ncbi:MAG TPA: RIO1 family regulatory kinase/ATPase [Chloroflexota bacterium]|nr:RIO1 family regulatory kinase/ATPase [Chloroflexota bacterium]